jgi:hypothetical protein
MWTFGSVYVLINVMVPLTEPKVSKIALVPASQGEICITFVVTAGVDISISTKYRKLVHLVALCVVSGQIFC